MKLSMPRALLAFLLAMIITSCGGQHDGPTPVKIGTTQEAVSKSFAIGSLVIPMDTTYQNNGTLKAFGLVYKLLTNGVPVSLANLTGKASGGVDFTASGKDLHTAAVI